MTHSQEKEMCMCNFIPPRGVHGEGCVNAKPEETTTSDWESVRLHECKECMSKPGSPVLCVSCQDNRASIEILKDCIRSTRTLAKKEFADELRGKIEKMKYGQPLLGTPETTERVMTAVDTTIDEVLALLPEQESR